MQHQRRAVATTPAPGPEPYWGRQHPLPDEVWDIDVCCGRFAAGRTNSLTSAAVRQVVRCAGVTHHALAAAQAAFFDVASGNDATVASAAADVIPVAVVDLRDASRIGPELHRMAQAGVRAVRLFGPEQGKEPDAAGVDEVISHARLLRMTILVGGPFSHWWRPFAGWGVDVVFLDTHFYELGDFLSAARSQPGFHTSTRLLNSPDALERVAGELGAHRLVLGTGTPRYEPHVPLMRLAASGLTGPERQAVAAGNAKRLLRVVQLPATTPLAGACEPTTRGVCA